MYSETYSTGYDAYWKGVDADENPHYTSFGDLEQDYYDWNKGWNAAEDEYYEECDKDD